MTIRAVLFDAAGVLTAPFGVELVAAALEAGADGDALLEVLYPMFATAGDGASMGNRLERGEVTLEDFFASLGPLEADVRLVIDPAGETFFGAAWAPSELMQAFVHEVSEAGYLTAMVSNIVHEWIPTWESVIPQSLPFDERIYSCVEGTRKPEPRIYEIALERLGIEPAEAVFLDDFPAMVEGARELGMAAVHVDDPATAIAETRTLLGLR